MPSDGRHLLLLENLFGFVHGLGGCDGLFLSLAGALLIADELHFEGAAGLSHGAQVDGIAHEFGFRALGLDDLLAVTGTSADNAYAVGTRGRVLRLQDGLWISEPSGCDVGLRAVCASPDGTVYAVGDRGTILRRGQA